MIGVKLMGGLGNQMFQYAAARSLAKKFSTEIEVDLSFYKRSQSRRYLLDRLHTRVKPADTQKLSGMQLYREKSFTWDASFEQLRDATLLEGYWQSERYFRDIRPVLLEEFKVKNPDPMNEALTQSILGSSSVSVHVRRGDYVSDVATNQYHGLCDLDYYRRAVREISARINHPKFFLFSDDPEWVRQHFLSWLPEATVISGSGVEEEDLRLLSLCRYHVIANSSFSWWGAWLSENPDKVVYAPKKWFAGANLDTHDLIPASWVRL